MPVESAGSLALPARVVIQQTMRGSSWLGESMIVRPFASFLQTTPIGSPATAGAYGSAAATATSARCEPSDEHATSSVSAGTTSHTRERRDITSHLVLWGPWNGRFQGHGSPGTERIAP